MSPNHVRGVLVLLLPVSRVIRRMMFERMALVAHQVVVMRLVVCWNVRDVRFVHCDPVFLQFLRRQFALLSWVRGAGTDGGDVLLGFGGYLLDQPPVPLRLSCRASLTFGL